MASPNTEIINSSVKPNHVYLDFGPLHVSDPERVNITVGDRSIDFFFQPDNYPFAYDGSAINLNMEYKPDSETMTVEVFETDSVASIDVTDMAGWQKSVALLYLTKVVTDDS